MSYSPALTYFLDRLNGFSTNIFRLEPQNNTTATANQIIRFSLPSNALLNTRSFALWFTAKVEGDGVQNGRLPAKIDSLIERVEITAGGIQLSQGVNFYNVLRHAKDALYGDKCNPTLGHPDILRRHYRDKKNGLANNNMVLANNSLEASTSLCCIDYWEGFLGTCEPKILDAAILPDLVISITLTSNNILTKSAGVGIPGDTITTGSTRDPPFTTAPGSGSINFKLENIHATIESIGLSDAVYDNLVASMIAQRGFVEVPFKQYVAFDGIHTSSTRFTIATQSLDRVWMCWRTNNSTSSSGVPLIVEGHSIFAGTTQNKGAGSGATEFEDPILLPQYDGTQVGEKYLSPYYNFVEPQPVTTGQPIKYQLQLNGAYYPQFQADAEEMVQISKNSLIGSSYVKNRTLGQVLSNYFVQTVRLNMPDSEFSRTLSGLDTRSVSLQGYINTQGVTVTTTDSPRLTVFCECTSTLRIGAGRMLESIM